MQTNHIYQGTCLDIISTFPDASIDCVITSPPYWQLRDYGWDGQWGLEPTYQMYLENLWSLMDEVYRVLKPTGTAWINLGDTYTGSNGGNYGSGRSVEYCTHTKGGRQIKGVSDKTLLLIPHRFAIGCIDRGWIMRNDIVWAKRNAMPESVTDRFSKKHEYFFFMTKSTKYYFDLDRIRDKHIYNATGQKWGGSKYAEQDELRTYSGKTYEVNELGKNPGSVSDFWDIPTKPSSKAHYATFNASLIDKPIVSGCPKGGIILDPFAGTATTLIRAYHLDRKVIGIEGNPLYVAEANKHFKSQMSQTKLFA